MSTRPELKFTKPAEERLNKLNNEFNEFVRQSIRNRKQVPSEDVIEVTAADIESLSRDIVYYTQSASIQRSRKFRLFTLSYVYLAAICLIASIVLYLVSNRDTPEFSPTLILLLLGLVFSVSAVLMQLLYKYISYKYDIASESWHNLAASDAARKVASSGYDMASTDASILRLMAAIDLLDNRDDLSNLKNKLSTSHFHDLEKERSPNDS